MRVYSGGIDATRRADGELEIRRADDTVSMSIGLLVQLARDGHITVRAGEVVLAGVNPDGQPREVVYAITGARLAKEPAAEEGGWLDLFHIEG